MGWIASEHKETKKRKKEKRKKEAVQDTHVPWTREKKERKTPRRHSSPGPGVLPSSPRHSSASRSRCCCPLAICRRLVPVVLVFSSLSFSPRCSSSPRPRRCHPPMEHPASSSGGGCWVTFVVNSSSRYLKSFRNKKHEKRINKNSPTAQETLFDISWAFFRCFASSDGVSPSSPRCCVVVQFGLMAALPSSCCLGVAPVTTPRAAACSGGGGCWVTFVISSFSRYLKKFSNKKT